MEKMSEKTTDDQSKKDVAQPAETPADTASPGSGGYTDSMIRVLDNVEHVRTRPGMYIGGYNPRGLHHLVYEIVDNSIDEAPAGYCKSIHVKINADGSCSLTDGRRRIPVGIHPPEGNPTVEVGVPPP